jgi:Asp-tRNA(Asn)/Glu-tRNA(Gln) amidotransferase A subunit family amidase
MDTAELVRGLRSGELPLLDYLRELEVRFETCEPPLQAFLPEPNRFARLRREAARLLERFPRPDARPALFGVPIGVKDIFHVDGFTTRAGSRVPAEVLRGPEAESVARLKAAGALLLGKTVTTEFAYFAPGPTHNPHNPAHTPGGSSSGSAAAVGAGLCPLALGTQTIGSIMRPAAFCGVVGFKPTLGRISTAGVVPLAPSFDHVGLFARDASGARRAAGVLCASWTTQRVAPPRPILGIPDGAYLDHASVGMRDHFQAVCDHLSRAGYQIKRVATLADFEAVRERHYLIVNGEAARVHRHWFPRFRESYHAKTVEKLELGRSISDDALARARHEAAQFSDGLTRVMDTHGIDGWISPSAIGPAPRGLESTGDPVMNLPWTQAGFPAISLRSGRSEEGLPLGLQLVARSDQDERLLAWAVEVEAALRTLR